MENLRYPLYVLTLGLVFLLLSVIKWIQPAYEPPPYDPVGMELYQPIFYDQSATQETEYSTHQSHEFVDSEIDEIPEKEDVSTTVVDSSLDDETYFKQFLITYKNTVLKKRRFRNDVVVRYYHHQPDGNGTQVLVEYGFYVHKRPIANEYSFKNHRSNVIYYGHDFPEEDLKLIAYLLVQNGMEIKRIQPFKDFDGWKHKAIEIGSSSRLRSAKTLTLSQIRNFKVTN